MLSKLCIKNYALIDDVEIHFDRGLTVITGETGAGKSILLGALGLVLGNRVERSFFKDQSKKCSIEAWFSIVDFDIKPFFQENDLDFEPETIIRREITPSGKSRIFINDSPSTLDIVQKLGSLIIDIHSQNQSAEINEDQFKFTLVDTLAKNQDLLNEYRKDFEKWNNLKRELADRKENLDESRKQEDYLRFQLEELEKLNLKLNEEEELDEAYEVLSHAEEIMISASKFNQILEDAELGLLSGLNEAKSLLSKLARLNKSFDELSNRLESSRIEIQDIHAELNHFVDNIESDDKRLQVIEDRLAEIHRLKLKHGLDSGNQLIEYKETLSKQLEGISFSEEDISKTESEIERYYSSLKKQATELSDRRVEVLEGFQDEVVSSLIQLEIPHASFRVDISPTSNLNSYGADKIEFLFSANKGIAPKLLSSTASGGEISRLMLSLKAQLAKFLKLPTILFDEIDTGISGEAAKKMGDLMKVLGQQRQVISITHLPQIASKGDNHLLVYKSSEADKTNSQIKKLDEEERIVEIAKMLSGNQISEAARNNAKELINNN